MERITFKVPRKNSLDEEWNFVVKDGDVALSLEVPAYRNRQGQAEELGPKAVSFHRAVARPEASRACEYVAGGRCYGTHVGYGWADLVWKSATNLTGFEQGEPFWLALEQELRDTAARERAQAVGIDGEGI